MRNIFEYIIDGHAIMYDDIVKNKICCLFAIIRALQFVLIYFKVLIGIFRSEFSAILCQCL